MSLASTCFTYIVHEIDFRLMKTGQKCHVAIFFVFSNFCDCFYAVHHKFQVQYIKRRPWLFSLYRVSVTAASLLFSSISLWNHDITLARTLTLYNSTRNFLSTNLTWDGWHFRRGEFYVIASSAHFSHFQLRDRPPGPPSSNVNGSDKVFATGISPGASMAPHSPLTSVNALSLMSQWITHMHYKIARSPRVWYTAKNKKKRLFMLIVKEVERIFP